MQPARLRVPELSHGGRGAPAMSAPARGHDQTTTRRTVPDNDHDDEFARAPRAHRQRDDSQAEHQCPAMLDGSLALDPATPA
jgi:hypothetical protein